MAPNLSEPAQVRLRPRPSSLTLRSESAMQLKRLLRKGPITKDLEVPLEWWRRALITFALGLAGFLVGLDQTIIEPALPTIVAQFQSVHDIGSYTSAYLLPQCVLQPLCNKLYSMFAFSTVYISSTVLFGAGCLVSATSQGSPAFIGGRALSGIGAVGLSIGGFRMLALMPETKGQNISMGAFSLILGSSIVVGPIIGGAITDSIGWHWIFWINLPFLGLTLVCILIATFFEGPDLRGENYKLPLREKVTSLDWLGTALLILTLVPLILGIEFGQTNGWNSAKSIVMFAVGVVSLGLLVYQQKTTKREVIFDPKVILNRSVWTTGGLFFSALSSVAVLVMFLPFLFQQERGLSARNSGFLTFALAGTLAIGTFIFSIVSTLVRYFNPLALIGTAIFLVANALFFALSTGSTSTSTIPPIVGFEVLAGAGLGMAWLAEIIYPRAELGKHQLATSLGYTRMMQQIGGAVSVQVAAAIFTSKLTSEIEALPFPRDVLIALVQGAAPGASARLDGQQLPEDAKEAVALAYGKAIRVGLIPAVVFAAISLLFAMALPWTRLKGGITDRGEVDPINSGTEELGPREGDEEGGGNENTHQLTPLPAAVDSDAHEEKGSTSDPTSEAKVLMNVDRSELTLVALADDKAEAKEVVETPQNKAGEGEPMAYASLKSSSETDGAIQAPLEEKTGEAVSTLDTSEKTG